MDYRFPFKTTRKGTSSPAQMEPQVQDGSNTNSVAASEHSISWRSLVNCSTREARASLPYSLCEGLSVLPLGLISFQDGQLLTVACASPSVDLERRLRFSSGMEVKLIAVAEDALAQALFAAYHGDCSDLTKEIGRLPVFSAQGLKAKKTDAQDIFRQAQGDAAKLLTLLVDYAVARQASDLHLIPHRDGMYVRLRIEGLLHSHEAPVCDLSCHNQIISRIKVLSRLDIACRSLPQDGAFTIICFEKEQNIRVSILATVHGEKAVLRFLGCSEIIPFERLGVDQQSSLAIEEVLYHGEGALLFSGPTGSGKSTTMYSVLKRLVVRDLIAASVEDPVELQLAGVSQTEVNGETGLSYARCLRSILRQDPDVILVGEIRDAESAAIAFQAALTGHLLLTSVHARGAHDVILRLKHLGLDALTIGQALQLVVCQRLLPRLCEKCKVFDLQGSQRVCFEAFKSIGCAACDYSGYSGRILATESLRITPGVAALLSAGDPLRERAVLIDEGVLVPLELSFKRLAQEGKISLRQVSAER